MSRSWVGGVAGVMVALGLLLAGCGGDSGGSPQAKQTPVDPAVTKYIADAEMVCQAAQTDIETLNAELAKKPTRANLQVSLREASTRLKAEIASLSALTVPPSLAERVDSWLEAYGAAAVALLSAAGPDGAQGVNVFADSDRLAGAVGVEECKVTPNSGTAGPSR